MKKTIKNYVTTIKPSIYYILCALFLLFEMGVQSSPSVMANALMHQLNLGAGLFGLAMGCYFFSYTAMQIPVGLLFDRYPAKRLLVCATLIVATGTYFFSIGNTVAWLAVARFLTGFGSAFAFVGVLVIANQWFEAQHFALLVGIAQLVAAVGAMVGEMPLAYWVKQFGWQYSSVLLALIGLGLSILMILFLKTRQPHLHAQQASPYQSLKNIAGNKQTYWIALYAFTAWAPITLFAELWGVPYLIVKQHMNTVHAAQHLILIWCALAVCSPALGFLSDLWQTRRPFLVLCSSIGLAGSSVLITTGMTGLALIDVLMLTIGMAAAAQILCFALIRDNFPKQDLAVAIGIINMAVVIGGALFQPLVGLILHWHAAWAHDQSIHQYTLQDYRLALILIPLCYAIGLLTSALKIKEQHY